MAPSAPHPFKSSAVVCRERQVHEEEPGVSPMLGLNAAAVAGDLRVDIPSRHKQPQPTPNFSAMAPSASRPFKPSAVSPERQAREEEPGVSRVGLNADAAAAGDLRVNIPSRRKQPQPNPNFSRSCVWVDPLTLVDLSNPSTHRCV